MQDYFTDKGKTDILRSTRTGLWEIILRQGREPVMHADSVMLELLGLDAAPEPEECYQVWYNRIQLCRRPCPRRLPVPGQRCRRSSINGTIPFGGPYPCGAAA